MAFPPAGCTRWINRAGAQFLHQSRASDVISRWFWYSIPVAHRAAIIVRGRVDDADTTNLDDGRAIQQLRGRCFMANLAGLVTNEYDWTQVIGSAAWVSYTREHCHRAEQAHLEKERKGLPTSRRRSPRRR